MTHRYKFLEQHNQFSSVAPVSWKHEQKRYTPESRDCSLIILSNERKKRKGNEIEGGKKCM